MVLIPITQTVNFDKLYKDTLLRIRWRGTLRSAYTVSSSDPATAWWQILINGTDDCNLKSLHYNQNPKGLNHHKASGSELT